MTVLAPHFSKKLFIGCVDDRLVEPHYNFISQIGGAFSVNMAGGGLAIVSEVTQSAALKQVTQIYEINYIDHVFIESHIDCGSYKLSGIEFASPEEEIHRLYSDLEKAKSLVLASLVLAGAHPNAMIIEIRVVDIEGNLIDNN